MMRARLVAMLLVVAGCASAPPRPASLVTLDRTLEGPVARESARAAPEAFAAVVTAAQRARGLEGARAELGDLHALADAKEGEQLGGLAAGVELEVVLGAVLRGDDGD